MNDPIAALRPVAVDIQLGEWEYTIPALPAARWIEAILDRDGMAIVPNLLGNDDRRDIAHRWLVGELDADEIAKAARAAIGVAAGLPWWQAVRFVATATGDRQRPVVLGDFARRGVDLHRISLGAFCDAVYALAVANASEEERQRLDAELSVPPAGLDAEDLDALYDEEEEADNFARDLAAQDM